MLRKFVSHTAIYGLASQLPKLAGVIALPFITKYLTKFDYGVYGLIMSYTSAIEVLLTLGLRVSLTNLYYKKGDKFPLYWEHLYGFLLQWSWVYAAGQFVLVYIILPDEILNKAFVASLCVGSIVFLGTISMVGSLFYQLKERPEVVGSISLIGGVLGVVLNVIFIAYLKMGFMGWIWSTFITGVITNAIYGSLMLGINSFRPRMRYSSKLVLGSLKVSIPTIPHFYSMFLLNAADRVIMNILKVSTNDIGKYSAAYSVGNIFQSLAMSSGFAITPLMMTCYKRGDESTARRLVWFLQSIFFMTTFTACLWMKEIFAILIKNVELSEMYSLGIVIVMAFNYRPIYYGAVNKLLFHERTRILWRISFIPGVICMILNFILIPLFGFGIAALTTFLTFSLVGILGYLTAEYKELSKIPYYPFIWVGINCMLTMGVYAIRDVPIVVKSMLSICVLVMIVVLLYLFKRLKGHIISK